MPTSTDDPRDRILDAALIHVPFDGWSETTFRNAARDAGVSVNEARFAFPRGPLDLALAFHKRGDATMEERLRREDLSQMRFRDRIAAAVRYRVEAVEDKEAARRGTAFFSLPQNAQAGARALWETADRIWTTLGDTSEDVNWYTKRATLSGVYGATVLYWLGDDSLGHQDTWSFLDRRIEDVMRIEKAKGAVNDNPLLRATFALPNWMLGRVRAPIRPPRGDLPGSMTSPPDSASPPPARDRAGARRANCICRAQEIRGETGVRRMSLPQKMRVVEISKPGGPEVLTVAERDVPRPGHGEIVIRVVWAGVNRPDALQRAGAYDPPPGASDLPGLEASGTVAAVGEGVSDWREGDEVCALLPGGGYAEYVATPAAHALPVPPGLGLREAACLPETYFTVWTNVFDRGALLAGERFLVHGGTSGIGTTAIQLAAQFGARVFATAGSDEKCAVCTDLGAERAINYKREDFVEVLRAEGGADLILDMVGGDYIPRNVAALANDGRLVQIAFLQGPKVELNFAQVMVRRLTITGSTLRPQSDLAKSRIAEALRRDVWPLLAAGTVAPVIDSEFPLDRAAQAHARLEEPAHVGKIVLKVA